MDDYVAQTAIGDELQEVQTPVEQPDDFTNQVIEYFGTYSSGALSASGLPLLTYGDSYDSGVIRRFAVEQYPQLSKNIYKNFVTGLGQQTFVVTQNKYTSQQDEYVLQSMSARTAKLTKKELAPLVQVLTSLAEATLIEPSRDRQDSIEELLQAAKQAIAKEFVIPYILPLEGVDVIADEKARAHLLSVQDAAVDRIFNDSREPLRHIYQAYFASTSYITKKSFTATMADAFTPKLVKDSLQRFIEDSYVSDAYQHIYALHRSARIADDSDLYVYFGELQYDGQKYPLFYTQVASSHAFPSMTLTFESRIFINKQAIEHVIRHYGARTNQYIDIVSLNIPDAIYSSEDIDILQQVITVLTEVLQLSHDLDLANPVSQTSTNYFVTLTNRLYFTVGSLPTTVIADEYAEIAASDVLTKQTREYLDGLLTKRSARFVEEVAESWNEKSDFDKLLPAIPLAVNDEQQQVLMALSKAACDLVVVNSAANTGKDHLVKATILTALGDGQTVLVVGNSRSTATRVYRTVAEALTQTSGKLGYNPVLNIHDVETLDRIDDQALADITASTQLVDSKQTELASAKKRKKQTLREGLAQYVQSAEHINLHEVEQAVLGEKRFAGKNWIEDEPIDAISSDMPALHRAIHYVRNSEAGYLMPYIEGSQQKAIEDFIAAFTEYEKSTKDVQERLPEFIVRYRKLLPDQKKHLQESLAYIQSNYRQFMKLLRDQPASSWLAINDDSSFQEIAHQEIVFHKVLTIARNARRVFRSGERAKLLRELDGYDTEPLEIIEAFNTYIEQIATLKSKLFGFSGRMLVVENLNKQLLRTLPSFSLSDPEKQSESMERMSQFVHETTSELAAAGLSTKHWKDVVHILLTNDSKIEEIDQIITSLNQAAAFDFVHEFKIHEADNILANITLLKYATELTGSYKDFPKLGKLFGITAMSHLLARPAEYTARITKLSRDLHEAAQLDDAKQTIKNFVSSYSAASKRMGINYVNGTLDVIDDTFAGSDSEYIKEYIIHKKKERDVRSYFDAIATDTYASSAIEYQQILGVELQHALNKNFLHAIESQPSLIGTASAILHERRRLASEELTALTQLFPCIAGELHTISNVLPLGAELFDIVIVDTADSLTIAEVLPIALRAKKVLVVGDGAQTSPATMPVSGTMNDLYASRLAAIFRDKLSTESADNKNDSIAKQEKAFVADRSALAFFAAYANYDLALRKQYGIYEELASFSNKYYYDNQPISLMSRAAPLTDLFKFSRVKPEVAQVTRFTNVAEVAAIVKQLHALKDQGYEGTIGIVTPFAEQAALIQKELDESVITDWFERRRLKVMTFDSRRHHARDYTFYSLVASGEFNELSQKLPSAIGFDAFAGDTRSQRLLEGFSGTLQTMHVMHSLPFDEYGGSVGETLKHFNAKFLGPTVKVKGGATDVLLPTEIDLNQAFDKTDFLRRHKDHAKFVAKYPFTQYIKPLSPNYRKATYKMFFLVMVGSRPIVIEFDDFKERFVQNGKADKDSGMYLTAQDIYGYRLLEGYNYRFLRLNKFNLGSDPAQTLDKHLGELIRTPSWPADNGFVA